MPARARCLSRNPIAEVELTPAQIAATHGVSRATVLRWVRDERWFPKYRILPGGDIRVPLSAYQEFLRSTEIDQRPAERRGV